MPVRGRIVRSFGQKDGIGGAAKGITIRARRSAQVIAPQAGAIVFAGPFKGLGQLLIIEHARGYHTLLAGLARIDAEVGDRVLTGEPVGVLSASVGGRPALYVELRRRGRPVNPLPWLTAGRTRVNG
ncbi:MAG: murein hydrolase activator EnvC family protein [Alphaproteobacteria bacterium]